MAMATAPTMAMAAEARPAPEPGVTGGGRTEVEAGGVTTTTLVEGTTGLTVVKVLLTWTGALGRV